MTSRNWEESLISENVSLQDAIRNLEKTGLQICLVVDPNKVLVGTLTDGDIRRGLLAGSELRQSISKLVQHDPLVVPPQMGRDMVLELMRANGIRHLPVVDSSRKVVGLHILDELISPSSREAVMVVMAGGRGTRLRPHTDNCPKPMLPVAGKPILEHIVERARDEGFRRFVFAVHYLAEHIQAYFEDGGKWEVEVDYLKEEVPLGTAGAIGLMVDKLSGPFVVTNGDVLTDIRYGDLLDFHKRNAALATMAVRLHEWQHPYGVVRTDGIDILGFEEKPVSRTHINAGVYALDLKAIKHIETGKYCDMPDLFSRLQTLGERTIVYPMHEPWLDIGRPSDYNVANRRS